MPESDKESILTDLEDEVRQQLEQWGKPSKEEPVTAKSVREILGDEKYEKSMRELKAIFGAAGFVEAAIVAQGAPTPGIDPATVKEKSHFLALGLLKAAFDDDMDAAALCILSVLAAEMRAAGNSAILEETAMSMAKFIDDQHENKKDPQTDDGD